MATPAITTGRYCRRGWTNFPEKPLSQNQIPGHCRQHLTATLDGHAAAVASDVAITPNGISDHKVAIIIKMIMIIIIIKIIIINIFIIIITIIKITIMIIIIIIILMILIIVIMIIIIIIIIII